MSELLPQVVCITDIVEETPSIRSFYLDSDFDFIPGQFVMVWVPGVDEIPMALSRRSSITVQRVGDATSALFSMKKNDRIGIRGPFGNGFSSSGRVLAVAGGVGAAPLLGLAHTGSVDTFLLGARSESELLFCRELSDRTDLHIATDDGSAGHHGFVIDLMERVGVDEYDTICVCGPERMMSGVLRNLERRNLAHRSQFSLHRYMKCGIGICGSCSIDPDGLRVCRDGPVFKGDIISNTEFGKYSRDASGRRKNL
jgi:2-polyprenylphenol hydroxylase and related flavodoxin oxidoreductases